MPVPRRHRPVALPWLLLAGLLLPGPALGQPAGVPPARTGASGAPATPEEQGGARVRTLEERVSDLKDKVFRTKERLLNLQEMVIGGDTTAGARAVIVHRNEMGSSFYLESASYALDGAPIYTKTDVDGDLDRREEFEVFNGRLSPGQHRLSVQLVFRGSGFGFFSYMQDYKFRQTSTRSVDVEAGKAVTVRVVAFEKGGLTSELKDRPGIRYEQEFQKEEPPSRLAAPGAQGPRK